MKPAAITLLYVEDNVDVRDMVYKELRITYPAVRIYSAGSGVEGLEKYREHHPDIIVTDINMPVMDGVQMAKEIKALNGNAIVIAVTAYSDTEYLLRAIDAGISHYLLKPVSYDKLIATIDECIDLVILKRKVREQNEHIRKLSKAVDSSPVSIIITDSRGTIEYVNPKFIELTGYNSEEAIGQNPWILKSGETPPEIYKQLWSTISAGKEWQGELLNRKKDGAYYWEAAFIAPIFDEEGAISNFVAVKEDITERKRTKEEIERLNADLAARAVQLEGANKELEAFNYTVSHDLRIPLSVIDGYVQLIHQVCGETLEEKCREYPSEISKAVARMTGLIDALLKFSRAARAQLHREEVDLTDMAKGIVVELEQAAPERRITIRIPEGIKANGDGSLLRVALGNIIGNAWKYTSQQEEAVIEFGVTMVGGETACFVRDNGPGFDMADAEKLFAPFQRLEEKPEFAGHGIGLATVERIIRRHGGRVWAEGEVGKGATFYFTLPAIA